MKKLKLKENDYLGKLIVFEGTDGAGKTTMITKTYNLLKEKYGSENVLLLKQPTDMARNTKLFQKMMFSSNHNDIDYRAVQLLTMSDRIQHGYEIIEPALWKGKIVICDRYIYTSYVNMIGRNYKKEKWFNLVSKHIIKPNIKILAYIEPDIAINRIKERPNEKDRYLDEELLRRVSLLFKEYAKKDDFTIIETNGTEEESFDKVLTILKERGLI